MENILLIGVGAVAKTLLELWNLEGIKISKITAIDPKPQPVWVKNMYPNMEYKQVALTKKNITLILTPILNPKGSHPSTSKSKPFVIDLSVDVDCIPIIKMCKKYDCRYINTSIEGWSEKKPWILKTSRQALIHRSLYQRQMEVEKILGTKKTSTILTNNGMNPGLVSSLVKQALEDYTKANGNEEQKTLAKGDEANSFAKLAKSLELEEIHISEIDTQKPNIQRPKNHFWSTWSACGFISEMLDPIQIGWGSNRLKNEGIQPSVGERNVRIFPIRGMDGKCKSFTLGFKGEKINIDGMMIPHAEADTINSYLTYGDYSPSVFYVYQPSQMALDSIDDLRKNLYHPPPTDDCKVLSAEEIQCGYDSVGTLLIFKNGDSHWCGSVLDITETRKLGFIHSGPTTVQVTSSIFASMKWINPFGRSNEKHHTLEGYTEPEDLEYKFILKNAKPYLGKFFSKTFKK